LFSPCLAFEEERRSHSKWRGSRKLVNKEILLWNVSTYIELPALWNVKSKQYHDRDKKNSAYETLLVKYKEMYPDATKDVKKKINSLRTNYRKELKKHHQSLKSGTGADDVG
jgi:nitrogen fixation-related uncharacterized protein